MVDRIDHKTGAHYWAVHGKEEPKHDGEKKDDGSSSQQDQFAERESLDHLLKRNSPHYKEVEIRKEEIKSFTFKKLLPIKKGAVLELDVIFHTGHVEKGVRLAVTHERRLDFMKLRAGAELALDHVFFKSPFLTVGIPQDLDQNTEHKVEKDLSRRFTWSSSQWLMIASLLAFFLMVLMLIRILLL